MTDRGRHPEGGWGGENERWRRIDEDGGGGAGT
jgi:hypothetical protein